MTFGDETKDDATFDAELTALISKARDDGVPPGYLDAVVATFYRNHGRAIPSPIVPPPP